MFKLDDGIFLRFQRPQEYGLEISHYRVEVKKLSDVDIKRNAKKAKVERELTNQLSSSSINSGNSVVGSVRSSGEISFMSGEETEENKKEQDELVSSVFFFLFLFFLYFYYILDF